MKDTSAEAQAEFRERLLATEASRRIQMVSGMFSTARVLAGAAANRPAANVDPPAVVLFERMYRTDFSAGERTVISEHLKTVHAGSDRSLPPIAPAQP